MSVWTVWASALLVWILVTIIGPIIGLVAVLTPFVVMEPDGSTALNEWPKLIVLGYIFGLAPAFLAGLCLAASKLRYGVVRFRIFFIAVLCGGLVTALFSISGGFAPWLTTFTVFVAIGSAIWPVRAIFDRIGGDFE